MSSVKLTGIASELTRAQQFLAQWWADNHLSDVERFPFELALEELFINVASYGQDETGAPCRVELALARKESKTAADDESREGMVCLVIRDDAPAFDPVALEIPDLEGAVQERKIGGLGIHLTRSVMDTIDYEYKDGRNQISVAKKIDV